MPPIKIVQPPPPWLPAEYEIADFNAIKALAAGTANPEQQQRALDWIINKVSDCYGFDYRQDSRDHAFASGRRFVGLQIIKALKVGTSTMVKR